MGSNQQHPSIRPVFNVLTDVKCYILYLIAALLSLVLYGLGAGLFGIAFQYLGSQNILGLIALIIFFCIAIVIIFYAYSALGIYMLEKHCKGNGISIKDAIIKALVTSHKFILPVLVISIITMCIATVIFWLWQLLITILPVALVFVIVGLLSIIIALFGLVIFAIVSGLIWDGYAIAEIFNKTVKVFADRTPTILLAGIKALVVIFVVSLIIGFIQLLFASSAYFILLTIGFILKILFVALLAILTVRLVLYIYQVARVG